MAGRKSKYESHVRPYLADIVKWVKMGEPQYIICKKLGINKATFCEYKNKYPELNEAIKKGSQFLDYEVIESLAKRAIGYDYEETKSIIEKLADGREKRKIEKTVKHIPPDTGAIALYMKNRRLLQSLDEEVKVKQIKLIKAQTAKATAEADIYTNRASKLIANEAEKAQINDLIEIGKNIIGKIEGEE
ncbi:hypothetical protein OLL18_001059 [Listeria monocytogenes]|uniref:hypothetical protein n=1 Tax=Listeria monocytogenes TaxID=1639 RepID=UPI0010E901ED|nr:hypothetical protein [Listeria monocytogenes]EAC8106252.1 hypothetical protein [Listeria monocytogenes]EAF3625781.1 hypothetical protein [Listeria monocytogenes]EAF4063410.1 hypothetical protein [Listeria monocytogenes]EKA5785958.1 hypothetical protein [Listeria monocytogenes]